ncbi:MAG: hypothetical protein BGP06_19780 [Rhizobiales bacterium 65-9]|nr:MAG: hypothetical protein BGP06_19780 [Rhizobiales bacterium 65-9]
MAELASSQFRFNGSLHHKRDAGVIEDSALHRFRMTKLEFDVFAHDAIGAQRVFLHLAAHLIVR